MPTTKPRSESSPEVFPFIPPVTDTPTHLALLTATVSRSRGRRDPSWQTTHEQAAVPPRTPARTQALDHDHRSRRRLLRRTHLLTAITLDPGNVGTHPALAPLPRQGHRADHRTGAPSMQPSRAQPAHPQRTTRQPTTRPHSATLGALTAATPGLPGGGSKVQNHEGLDPPVLLDLSPDRRRRTSQDIPRRSL